jgi:hypothetical protein
MLRWLWIVLAVLGAIQTAFVIKLSWRGYHGLDQWPMPYGRYYKRWRKLPESDGDYYEWLAHQMGNREPWKTWATMEKELPRSQ